jgi:hypothetical protein
MKIIIKQLKADIKFYLPRSLIIGFFLSCITTFYLTYPWNGWTIYEVVSTILLWLILWTFAALCIYPKVTEQP